MEPIGKTIKAQAQQKFAQANRSPKALGLMPNINDIPQRYRKYALDAFSSSTVNAMSGFENGEKNTVYIHGGVGSKKTSFVAAYVRYLRERYCWATFSTGAGAFVTWDRLRRACVDMGGSGGQRFDDWMNASLVVIDDIGRARSTDHMVECYMMIVNYRYDRCLPTIYTSNCNLLDLTAFFKKDPNVSSRLSEAIIIDFGDKDYRQEGVK